MSKIKVLGAALAVAAAVVAVGAASASATLPEFGECVKAPAKNGEFTGKSCVTKAAANNGGYRWKAGPPAKPKFEGLGESMELETTSKRKVVCGGAVVTGEYTGVKTESVNVHLIGCTDSVTKESCESNLATEGEIETLSALTGEIGFIRGGEFPIVGLDLKPTSPNPYLLVFTCGNPPKITVTEKVSGSVISTITPQTRLTEEFTTIYRGTAGKQRYASFEGGEKDTLSSEFTSGIESHSEVTALKGKVIDTNEEALQIKSKP
jgi:hypothetical protein